MVFLCDESSAAYFKNNLKYFVNIDFIVFKESAILADNFYKSKCQNNFKVVNRPGVARAVLQTPLSLIHSFTHS